MAAVPRILMMPGYTQNAAIFASKLGAVRKGLVGSCELVFVDPPHVVNMPTTSSADFDSTADSTSSAPEDIPRAWWFAERKEGFKHFSQLEECIVYFRKVLEEQGPFDGVWGFSQGAAAASMITALVARPELHPEFARPGDNWPPAPFKFTIMVGGFLPADVRCAPWFKPAIDTPTLHIIGRGDTIVDADRSAALLTGFVNPRVEYHEGGHYTPAKASWRRFLRQYIEATQTGAEVPSPSAAPEALENGKL